MTQIIPPFLKPGDEVAILSPASFPPTDNWKMGVEVLENCGLRVRNAPNYLSRHHGLGGTDAERLSDLQQMLDDPAIKDSIQEALGDAKLAFEVIGVAIVILVGTYMKKRNARKEEH